MSIAIDGLVTHTTGSSWKTSFSSYTSSAGEATQAAPAKPTAQGRDLANTTGRPCPNRDTPRNQSARFNGQGERNCGSPMDF